jgi:multisubunit Na+/H+ antiporter MnhC subunit
MMSDIFLYLNQKEVIHSIVIIGSMALFFVGLFGLLSQKNIIKIFISISIMETSIFVLFIGSTFIKGYTAPILGDGFDKFINMNDPVPHAMILTAIVIGMALFALGMSFAIEYYKITGITEVDKMREMKQ